MKWICLLAAIALAVGCSKGEREEVLDISHVESPDKLTLYSLEPEPLKTAAHKNLIDDFYGYPVLGKIEVENTTTRRQLMAALMAGIERARGQPAPSCIIRPRHGLRVVTKGQTVDYVICFKCGQIQIHGSKEATSALTTRVAKPTFNRVLTVAGITLAADEDGK